MVFFLFSIFSFAGRHKQVHGYIRKQKKEAVLGGKKKATWVWRERQKTTSSLQHFFSPSFLRCIYFVNLVKEMVRESRSMDDKTRNMALGSALSSFLFLSSSNICGVGQGTNTHAE